MIIMIEPKRNKPRRREEREENKLMFWISSSRPSRLRG
jgi:hypothetical protein